MHVDMIVEHVMVPMPMVWIRGEKFLNGEPFDQLYVTVRKRSRAIDSEVEYDDSIEDAESIALQERTIIEHLRIP